MGNPYLRIKQEGRAPYAWFYATYTIESEWPELAPYSETPPTIEFRVVGGWLAGGGNLGNVETAGAILSVILDGEEVALMQVPRRLTIDRDTAAFYYATYATDPRLDIKFRGSGKILIPAKYRKELEFEANRFIDTEWRIPQLNAPMSTKTLEMLGDVLEHAGKYFTVEEDVEHTTPYNFPIKWAIWPSDLPFNEHKPPEEPFPLFWMARPPHWHDQDDYPEPGDVTFTAKDIIIAAYKALKQHMDIDPETFKVTIPDDDPNLLKLTELIDEAIQKEKRGAQ